MTDIEDILKQKKPKAEARDMRQPYISPNSATLVKFTADLLQEVAANSGEKLTKATIDKICNQTRKKHRIQPNKPDIRTTVEKHFPNTEIPPIFQNWLKRKGCRTISGVKVVTIVASPDKFSCEYDCAMCPQERNLKGEPTQPRSYISSEPAMLRALQTKTSADTNLFDVKGQFLERINTYIHNGIIDKDDPNCEKIEVIVSGGTWDSYRKPYREQLINEVYWAANTLFNNRPMMSLAEEQEENETAKFRVIGLTLETRPDKITKESIMDYLRWGVTRMQIGVQHFDDEILKKINRKCYTKHTIEAIRLLKESGFKVVVHLMPDLPGSNPEKDKWMFEEAIQNPDLQFDDVKLYPTAVTKSHDPNLTLDSKIADWYKEGSYTPYSETSLQLLIDVLVEYKRNIQPWVRIQRLVRDIPDISITAGYNSISNLRQIIHNYMHKQGIKCKCIFCMEIGDRELDNLEPKLVVRTYKASQGTEYHISYEAHNLNLQQTVKYYAFLLFAAFYWFFTGTQLFWNGSTSTYDALFGFLRLRIDKKPGGDHNKEINGCGLIREVHVYGTSLTTSTGTKGSQHRGFGQKMMKAAEAIIMQNGLKKAAVIAGIGTREYYKNKCGYTKGTHYMLKNLKSSYLELLRWALAEYVWIGSCILIRNLRQKNE